MRVAIWMLALGTLAGCSPDAATTAVTAGKLAAEQAEQAKAQQAQFRKELGSALQATEEAASAAAAN